MKVPRRSQMFTPPAPTPVDETAARLLRLRGLRSTSSVDAADVDWLLELVDGLRDEVATLRGGKS